MNQGPQVIHNILIIEQSKAKVYLPIALPILS